MWSLAWFPFVHSDEAWLASLSRSIISKGPAATEDFFVLTERTPHLFKVLFHFIQGVFLRVSWSVTAARMPSFISGILSLVLFLFILRSLGVRRGPVALALSALALDVQFFYTSHLGRQEAPLILFALAALAVRISLSGRRGAAAAGIIIGLSGFIHPNAFIIAWALLPWIITDTGSSGKDNFLNSGWGAHLLIYSGAIIFFAGAGLAGSLLLDQGLFSHYRSFGESVGAFSGPIKRLALFFEFFEKMFLRWAGTYYLAPVRFQLIGLGLLLSAGLFPSLRRVLTRPQIYQNRVTKQQPDSKRPSRRRVLSFRRAIPPGIPGPVRPALAACLLSCGCTLFSVFLIGKYSPPSLVFLFPWFYLGLALLHRPSGPMRYLSILTLTFFLLSNSWFLGRELIASRPEHLNWPADDYNYYLERLKEGIGPEDKVLASLNSGFAFGPGRLRVWHDLAALPPSDDATEAMPLLERPFIRFLRQEDVRWIILPADELDLIFRNRPVWNSLYGNPYRFYPDLKDLLDLYGILTDRFEAPRYGMRLLPFTDKQTATIEIYRLVLPGPGDP